MMVSIQRYVRRGRRTLRRWVEDPGLRVVLHCGGHFLTGLVLSAGSLAHRPLPLALGLVCAASGWQALLTAVGSAVGYWLFWGSAGVKCMIWLGPGLLVSLCFARKRVSLASPLLIPAAGMFIVAATGLVLQVAAGDRTAVPVYFLQVLMAGASAGLFSQALMRRDPIVDWLTGGLGVLALAQVAPIPWLGLGYVAAGALGAAAPFPAAVMAGLALDLAQVAPIPMTGVLCLACLPRLLPRQNRYLNLGAPALACLLVMGLCGIWYAPALPGLALGGLLGYFVPAGSRTAHRRGETGIVQVRLEMVSGVLAQSQRLLLETVVPAIDEEALIFKAADRACAACPCRKGCKDRASARQMPPLVLHNSLSESGDLPATCKKAGRLLQEMRRSQTELRMIQADRARQTEYREAVAQQYRFLSDYLQDLSDRVGTRPKKSRLRFQAEVAVCSAGRESANGDRCLWFAGTEGKYYVVLCDGMGTGLGAAQEGQDAGNLLRRLLGAGFPAEFALRSVNSLCTLRGKAGAATMDVAEICLDSGKTAIYKWGAAPSYLISGGEPIKIGTAGPPPGLSVTEGRETVERLSLRRGETLVLLSDGAGGEEALRRALEEGPEPPGELAARVLEGGDWNGEDDATVAVVRLMPLPVLT